MTDDVTKSASHEVLYQSKVSLGISSEAGMGHSALINRYILINPVL